MVILFGKPRVQAPPWAYDVRWAPTISDFETSESRRGGRLWETEALLLNSSHINSFTQNFNTEAAP